MPRPLTDAQKAACQQNAQNSTGPRSPEGKAKAKLNALKHGLTAKLPLLPFESDEDFQALKAGFLQDFAPRTSYQTFLTHQLATHAWRILRSQQVEVGLQHLLLKQVIHDLEAQGHDTARAQTHNPYAGLALTLQPPVTDPQNHLHRNLFRYLRDIQTQFHRTRQALLEALKLPPPPEKPIESTTPGFVSSPPQKPATHSAPRPHVAPAAAEFRPEPKPPTTAGPPAVPAPAASRHQRRR